MDLAEKRLKREIEQMKTENYDNVFSYAKPMIRNIFHWEVELHGPPNTPYEGGKFLLEMEFPENYPFQPPLVTFITKVYHPNINKYGNICVDILRKRWTPALTIPKLLMCISLLLTEPNPDDPLEIEIAW